MAASLDRGSYGVSIRLHSYQRLCKTLPPHLILARNQRSERVLCQAVALPQGVQYWLDEVSAYIFRRPQKAVTPLPEAVESRADTGAAASRRHSMHLKSLFLVATTSALHAGLRLTGVALRLAKIVVEDLGRSLRSTRLLKGSSEDRASQIMRDAQTQLLQKAKRESLEMHGRDTDFMQMLRTLDRCHMDHDEKWALFIKHSADKAEFSERWRHLYKLAMASKSAVDTLLRPDASRSEINQFWKSAQTSAIIAEEDALKQLVFAQVFQSGHL